MIHKLSRQIAEVTSFQAVEIFQAASVLERHGRPVVHLEFGEPDFETPEIVKLAAIEAITANHTRYTHSLGIPSLREQICRYHNEKYGIGIVPEQVVVSNGTSLLTQMLMLMLLEPGDEVIVADPTYACYENFVRIAHGRPVRVPIVESEGFQLDPAKVRAAITPRTRAVMVCSPANPTGVVTRPEVLAEIAALGVPVISDEIYHGLSYSGRDRTMLEFTQNAFILNGFSKYFAMTGWRLGYLIAPLEIMPAVMKLHQNIMISATDFSQVAGQAAMAEAVPICETYRVEYDRRRVYLMERLAAMGLPLGYEPTGAFYAFVNVSRYTSDSIAFAMQILNETGVAMTPGADFGPGGEGYLRISYANSLENIAKGMDQLQVYLQTLRP